MHWVAVTVRISWRLCDPRFVVIKINFFELTGAQCSREVVVWGRCSCDVWGNKSVRSRRVWRLLRRSSDNARGGSAVPYAARCHAVMPPSRAGTPTGATRHQPAIIKQWRLFVCRVQWRSQGVRQSVAFLSVHSRSAALPSRPYNQITSWHITPPEWLNEQW